MRESAQPQHAPRKYPIFLLIDERFDSLGNLVRIGVCSELELIAFRHTSTAENLGLDDDPDSQMKKVAEAAHPDFAVLVPSCREISISTVTLLKLPVETASTVQLDFIAMGHSTYIARLASTVHRASKPCLVAFYSCAISMSCDID